MIKNFMTESGFALVLRNRDFGVCSHTWENKLEFDGFHNTKQ